MNPFDSILKRGTSIARLLIAAGMDPSFISTHRAFASNWAWEDGRNAYATIWVNEVNDPETAPHWHISDPRSRADLSGHREHRAQALFDILKRHAGRPIRVIVQTRKRGPNGNGSEADRRGLDPEFWFSRVEGDTVHMHRGSLPSRKDVSVSGKPMPSRPPTLALRETRPEQVQFRKRVSAKTASRCALTGAPEEVCDAAHFSWADWRTDNEAHHGVLIRRDLHAALDCKLLSIDETGNVLVSEYLGGESPEYRDLEGRTVPIYPV